MSALLEDAGTMLDAHCRCLCSWTRATTEKPQKVASGSKGREGPSVTELGLSLATLRKAPAAGGYDVEKNKSCSMLGLKSLVSNGTLGQPKGLGASGSFKLNKKPGETKEKATKKNQLPCPRSQQPRAAVKESPKKAKDSAAKKAAKSAKRAAEAGPKKAVKSPAKVKEVKPKAAKPNTVKPKMAKAKKAEPKRK
uniref:H15 domain-containing protein n=1 Tax=Taeniopygia guttata TaxID=59729 RepID=A0A674HJ61_TAEGU